MKRFLNSSKKRIIVTFENSNEPEERFFSSKSCRPFASCTLRNPCVFDNNPHCLDKFDAICFFLLLLYSSSARSSALEVTRRFDLSASVNYDLLAFSTKDGPAICRSIFSDVWPSFFNAWRKKRSLPCGFPQPRKSSNSEVNRITIKFLRCNYHEREIAGETISSTLCIKSLILFLKSTSSPPYFSFSLPSSLRIWITRNRHTSLVVHANADVRFDKSASKSNRYHSPPPSPIRLEIYSNTRSSFPINETEGITSAYIADYSRLRGEKNNLGFVLHFRGPSTLPPFSSPFGILGAKIFYNNNDRRNSKNAIHGIFHTIRYHHNPTKEKKESRKEDYHFE